MSGFTKHDSTDFHVSPKQRRRRLESVQLAQAARRVVLAIGAARQCSVRRAGRPVPAALTVLGPSKQRDATRTRSDNFKANFNFDSESAQQKI